MESDYKSKEIDIENSTCYYLDDIIKTGNFDEQSYENILFYNISYKIFIDSKPLRIKFHEIDVFIRFYHGTRYSLLFGSEKCNFIYNRIRYLKSVKSGITYVNSHNYAKIKVDSYDLLPLEKTMTLHNVIMLIKSV